MSCEFRTYRERALKFRNLNLVLILSGVAAYSRTADFIYIYILFVIFLTDAELGSAALAL